MFEVSGLVASAAAGGGGGSTAAAATLLLQQQVLTIGRGGAAIVAASAVTSTLTEKALQISPGGGRAKKVAEAAAAESGSGSFLGPRAAAVLCMAIAMSFHYLGYSLARPITISLFTSSSLGYGGFPAAFPFAMAFVSPMSLLLLIGYGKVLDKHGPRGALNRSTLLCALTMSASALSINLFEKWGTQLYGIAAPKYISGPLFVFRESYVQLLTSQYWSFMASALTPSQSAKWFGPIAGLTSITSAIAGFCVSDIIDSIGISYALLGTGLTLLGSLVAVNLAYGIADKHGFSPTAHKKHGSGGGDGKNNKKGGGKNKANEVEKEMGMVEKASSLFKRVPVLGKLFAEILASQGLATILNVAFVARLGKSITDDAERAGWVGKFFSTINVITMVLQFGVLPPLLTIIEPKIMWRIVPFVAMIFTTFQACQKDPTLYIVSTTLLVMKVLEYSARRMLDEMVFVPLDFESRFVGKEVIGVFGYRFGKSLMSLGLSGLTAIFGNFGIQEYSIISALVNLVWFKTAWSLSNFVPTRKEAEEIYQQRNKKGKR